jgi:ribosomal protein S18 acetylase RimI-like enzyme
MVIDRIKKIAIIGSIVWAMSVAVGGYYYYAVEQGPIYNFDAARDTQPIVKLFDENWYWLVASENFSPIFILKHRSPNENPKYFGALKIKVLRVDDQLAGFVAYYMKVGHEFRGKKYGHLLSEYAVNDLVKMGAKTVTLVTRVSNLAAQKIYKDLGFVEIYHDPQGYLYFEYTA